MRVTMLCLVCSITPPPLIRWTMMFWSSACQGRTESARTARLRLIRFGPVFAIADRQSSTMGSVCSLCCGVPQSSELGLLLYTADLGEIAASLGLSSHFYGDDSQLYTWAPSSTVSQQRRRMELGVGQIAEWMRSNRLRLNPEKTGFLWCATPGGVSILTPVS